MGIIGIILLICFFIGIFNAVTRILFGIGWCAFNLAKIIGVILLVLIILSFIGGHM